MLSFRDFVPAQLSQDIRGYQSIVRPAEYDSFEKAAEAASVWLDEQQLEIELVQVETVVLPNMWRREEEGSTDGSLRSSGKTSTYWHQFVRNLVPPGRELVAPC